MHTSEKHEFFLVPVGSVTKEAMARIEKLCETEPDLSSLLNSTKPDDTATLMQTLLSDPRIGLGEKVFLSPEQIKGELEKREASKGGIALNGAATEQELYHNADIEAENSRIAAQDAYLSLEGRLNWERKQHERYKEAMLEEVSCAKEMIVLETARKAREINRGKDILSELWDKTKEHAPEMADVVKSFLAGE